MPFPPSFPLPIAKSPHCKALAGAALLTFALLSPARADIAPAVPVAQSAVETTPPLVVFEVILAEIALKRNKPQVALAAYADLVLKYNDPEIFRRTIEVAAINRQPELMLEGARLWVQKDPSSVDALNVLSSAQILLGRYADAQPVLLQYFAVLPEQQRPQEFLRLNQRFPAQADPQRARKLIEAVTAPYVMVPEAQLVRGQAAWRTGDEAAALDAVGKARSLQPDSEAAILLNTQILAKRSPTAALDAFADYLARYPKAASVRALYAQQLLAANHSAAAIAQVRLLVEQPGTPAEPLFAGAAIALQAQDPALAIVALNRLLQIESVDRSLIRYNLGLAYETEGEILRRQGEGGVERSEGEAVTNFIEVQPGEFYVPARLRAANVLARQGDLKAARALLATTPAADKSTRTELVMGEAVLLREQGDAAGGLQVLEVALRKDPDNVLLRYELGMLAERAGKMGLFERTMREVIRRDPKYAQAYNALGFTFADHNTRLKESRVLLEKALALSPADPFTLDSMGWLCYREKNYPLALDYLNRAAALRADPEIVLHQVIVLRAMGREEEAARMLKSGLQQFPDNAELKAYGAKFPALTPVQSRNL